MCIRDRWTVDRTGQASLFFQTSRTRYLWLGGEVLLWLVGAWYLWHTRVAKESERDLALVREGFDR